MNSRSAQQLAVDRIVGETLGEERPIPFILRPYFMAAWSIPTRVLIWILAGFMPGLAVLTLPLTLLPEWAPDSYILLSLCAVTPAAYALPAISSCLRRQDTCTTNQLEILERRLGVSFTLMMVSCIFASRVVLIPVYLFTGGCYKLFFPCWISIFDRHPRLQTILLIVVLVAIVSTPLTQYMTWFTLPAIVTYFHWFLRKWARRQLKIRKQQPTEN